MSVPLKFVRAGLKPMCLGRLHHIAHTCHSVPEIISFRNNRGKKHAIKKKMTGRFSDLSLSLFIKPDRILIFHGWQRKISFLSSFASLWLVFARHKITVLCFYSTNKITFISFQRGEGRILSTCCMKKDSPSISKLVRSRIKARLIKWS